VLAAAKFSLLLLFASDCAFSSVDCDCFCFELLLAALLLLTFSSRFSLTASFLKALISSLVDLLVLFDEDGHQTRMSGKLNRFPHRREN